MAGSFTGRPITNKHMCILVSANVTISHFYELLIVVILFFLIEISILYHAKKNILICIFL